MKRAAVLLTLILSATSVSASAAQVVFTPDRAASVRAMADRNRPPSRDQLGQGYIAIEGLPGGYIRTVNRIPGDYFREARLRLEAGVLDGATWRSLGHASFLPEKVIPERALVDEAGRVHLLILRDRKDHEILTFTPGDQNPLRTRLGSPGGSIRGMVAAGGRLHLATIRNAPGTCQGVMVDTRSFDAQLKAVQSATVCVKKPGLSERPELTADHLTKAGVVWTLRLGDSQRTTLHQIDSVSGVAAAALPLAGRVAQAIQPVPLGPLYLRLTSNNGQESVGVFENGRFAQSLAPASACRAALAAGGRLAASLWMRDGVVRLRSIVSYDQAQSRDLPASPRPLACSEFWAISVG